MRSLISWSASTTRTDLLSQPPAAVRSSRRTAACSLVTPTPDFFGRSCSGLRVIRRWRPPIVASSSTSVVSPGAAWSERSRLAAAPLPRHPAVEGERDRVEQRRLARAGLAVQQEQPLQVVEGDLLGPGERAEGLDAEPVRAHQRPPSRVSLAAGVIGGVPGGGERGREQLVLELGRLGVAHVPDELGGDREVVAALDPLAVAALVPGHPLGLEVEREDVREPAAEPVHRRLRPGRVGERDGDEIVLVVGVLGRREQVVDAAGELGQPPVDRGGDPLDAGLAVDADLDQPAPLLVVLLGERVGQRGAAVAQVLRERLLAVQVAEGDVAEPVEERGGHVADAADRDVPLGAALLPRCGVPALVVGAPGRHPRVRHHHRAVHAPGGRVGADAGRRLAEHGRVAALPRRLLAGARVHRRAALASAGLRRWPRPGLRPESRPAGRGRARGTGRRRRRPVRARRSA